MHCYETIYIMHPDLGDEAVEAAKTKVEETLAASEGRIYHRENWGKKRLAYTVAKQQRGIYQLIQFIGNGQSVADLERLFRLDEAYIKHLVVRLKQDPATAQAQAEEAEAKAAERAAAERTEEKAEKAEPAEKPARPKARAKKEAADTDETAEAPAGEKAKAPAGEKAEAPADEKAEAPAGVGD